MIVDLHCHSTRSDGSHAPEEVARMAARSNVELFCLTDHDTDAGYEATRDALQGQGVNVLRGMELSCRAYDRTVHLLLYGLRDGPGLDQLHARVESIQASRVERLRLICGRLRELGVELDADAIVSRSHGRTPGRPDVARALVAAGVCTSPKEAFSRFLRDGGPADVQIDRISLADGVAIGREAGARMSLAHPHALGHISLVRDAFVKLRDEGLEGLEAYYGSYGERQRVAWLRLAAELDLVVTGGSDFHGEMLAEITRLGIDLPDPYATRLKTWLRDSPSVT